jgi:hypothetical protein
VVIRKVSGSPRSATGTKTRMALASLFHYLTGFGTWRILGELSCL